MGKPPPLTISPATLPNGLQGTFYQQALNFSGGVTGGPWGPGSYRVVSGYLPPGLQLSSTGVILGTPSWFGTYVFTVRVQDAYTLPFGRDQVFTLKITAVVKPPF